MAAIAARKNKSLDSSLQTLSISSNKSANTKSKPTPESWEDEIPSPTSPSTPTQPDSSLPDPPPPTPISPSHHRRGHSTDWAALTNAYPNSILSAREDKRPEKTTATASRMISGALGIKNQKTDEQKEYEKAVREKERRRLEIERNERRKKEKDSEEAKRAIWED